MKRKVIKQGNGTLTITLPKEWCNKFNIKGKDDIDVREREKTLIIGSEKEVNLDKVRIDITGLDRTSIMYYIRALYRRGFDEIVINFDNSLAYHHRIEQNKKVISVIHEEVNRLVGVEIIDQKDTFCIIKDISADSFKDFNTIVRKVFLLISDALNDILISSKEFNQTLLQEIEEKHNTITKFISYCLRLLNKQGYVDYRKTIFLYTIIECLDIITDIVKYSARDMLAYNKNLKKETRNSLNLIKTSFHTFYELFYKFDLKNFAELNKIRDSALKDIDNISKIIPGKEVLIIKDMMHILEIIREISGTRMGLEY